MKILPVLVFAISDGLVVGRHSSIAGTPFPLRPAWRAGARPDHPHQVTVVMTLGGLTGNPRRGMNALSRRT
jgi:hypothetical protein